MDLLDSVYENLEPALELLARYDAGIPISSESADLVFLSCEQVIELHGKFSDAPLCSRELLESAVARPEQAACYSDPTVWELAAILAGGIIRNHPFADGNKRIALLALGAFLAINGKPVPGNPEKAARLVIALAEKRIAAKEAGEMLTL